MIGLALSSRTIGKYAPALLGEWIAQEHIQPAPKRRMRGSFGHIRRALTICVADPVRLAGRQVGMIRAILQQYLAKRGAPDSESCRLVRARQQFAVRKPWHSEVAPIVVQRLAQYDRKSGLDDPEEFLGPVTSEEAKPTVPAEYPIPGSIKEKVRRAASDTIDALVSCGLISSGEMLASVLPQMTADIRAAGIGDPALRQLYGHIYRAFRRRRSLLLLNLAKQVQISELPWVAAIERRRDANVAEQEAARQALKEVTAIALQAFPHVLLPNKLLQEMRALAASANLPIPFTEELAADIFMGKYTPKFVAAAQIAGELLQGSLYARYYAIDFSRIPTLPAEIQATDKARNQQAMSVADVFAELCDERAGESNGRNRVVANVMRIEQQQILTTHNLAALHSFLGLEATLGKDYAKLSELCFAWICNQFSARHLDWHTGLKRFKNCAYAWRQMLFYLSLQSQGKQHEFIAFARAHLKQYKNTLPIRLEPFMDGLSLAIEGSVPSPKQRFLGWVDGSHELLGEMCGS
jgi:hypothetical protein